MKLRNVVLLMLFLSLVFCVAACEEDDEENVDEQEYPETDDDTGEEPDYEQPWEDPPQRPMVTINQPQAGSFYEGNTLVLSGVVTGLPVDEVLVNGDPLPVTNGQFQTNLFFTSGDILLPIYISAQTEEGQFGADRVVAVKGESEDPTELVDDALLLSLGDEIFSLIGGLLAGALNDLDLMPFLEPLNPIIDWPPFLEVEFTAAEIGGADLAGFWADDGLHLTGALNDVTIAASVTIPLISDEITLNLASMDLDMVADVLVKEGTATVSIASIDLAHGEVTYEGSLIGEWIVDALLGVVEWALELAVGNLIPGLIEPVLADLGFDTVVVGFGLEAQLTTLDVGPGASVAGMALNVYLTDPNPHSWPYAVYATPGEPPDVLYGRPVEAESFGLGIALSDELMNRLLFAATESELFHLEIGDDSLISDGIAATLTAGSLSGLITGFAKVDPSIPATIRLRPEMPLMALAEEDGSMTLHVPDYRVDFYLHPPDESAWRALSLSASLAFALDQDVQSDGSVRISFPEATVGMLVIDNPLGDSVFLFELIGELVTNALAPLLNLVFENLPINIPPLGALQIDPLWLGTSGENLDYWTAYIGTGLLPDRFELLTLY